MREAMMSMQLSVNNFAQPYTKIIDWDENYRDFFVNQNHLRNTTVKTYKAWTLPWVEHLKTARGVPSDDLLKQYMNKMFAKKDSNRTYNRIGKHLIYFTNLYLGK